MPTVLYVATRPWIATKRAVTGSYPGAAQLTLLREATNPTGNAMLNIRRRVARNPLTWLMSQSRFVTVIRRRARRRRFHTIAVSAASPITGTSATRSRALCSHGKSAVSIAEPST